jgi:cell fate (sporulation/competence/biofilm development) regulator YlbF (YheA/YmcA/DUF963 family)
MKGIVRNISIFGLSVLLLALQGCYTNRPIAQSVSSPDYNKRVSVAGAQYKKKGNAIDVVFNIGLIGAGAYGGYNLNMVQQQTANGREPVKGANVAIGALTGASIAYLIDQIAGKNKTSYPNKSEDWIRKANDKYRFMYGDKTNFTMINSGVENSYSVQNLNDVKDFKTAFPNSNQTENVVNNAINSFSMKDLISLNEIYPQYADKINAQYLRLALAESPVFDTFKYNIGQFPQALRGVSLDIDYNNEEQIKGLFAQFDQYALALGVDKVRKYKNDILDELPVIHSVIDKEYEDLAYNMIASSTNYTTLYKFAQRFPNSDKSKAVTEKANGLKYASYSRDYKQIKQELASFKDKVENKQYAQATDLEKYVKDFSLYGSYDPDNVKREIQAVESYMPYAKYYSVYRDVQQTVKGIISGLEKGQYPTSADLRSKLDKYNQVKTNDTDNVSHYMDNASRLCVILDGVSMSVPDSYREFSLGGAALGVLGTIISGGNLRAMAAAKPMNTKLAQEHQNINKRAVDIIIDEIGPQINSENYNIFGEDIPLSREAGRAISRRLIELDKKIVATYNNDVENHNSLVSTLGNFSNDSGWSGILGSSSSSSSGSSSSSSDDLSEALAQASNDAICEKYDDRDVTIPEMLSDSGWKNCASENENMKGPYDCREIKFKDGVSGTIQRWNKTNEAEKEYHVPFVSTSNGVKWHYKTEADAIKALYFYKKCTKNRGEGHFIPKDS